MPIEPRTTFADGSSCAAIIDLAADSGQRRDPRVITCKHCGGWAPRHRDGRNPAGWYTLSVAISPELTTRERGYAWVGAWCSIACLAAAVPDLQQQEQLAHLAYSPVRPVGR